MYQAYIYSGVTCWTKDMPSSVNLCIFVDLDKKSAKKTIENLVSRHFSPHPTLLLDKLYSAVNLKLISISFHTPNLGYRTFALYDDNLKIAVPVGYGEFLRNTIPFVTVVNGTIQERLTLSYGRNFLDSTMIYV